MNAVKGLAVVWIGMLSAGCGSTSTRVVAQVKEVPRVDIELEGVGNRGYITGAPPATGVLRSSRRMLETTVEIPNFLKARGPEPKASQVLQKSAVKQAPTKTASAVAAEQQALQSGNVVVQHPIPEDYTTYVVQEGDSLWSIAAKPEVFGKATLWRELYEANRDILNSPEDLQSGMELKVPQLASISPSGSRSAYPSK